MKMNKERIHKLIPYILVLPSFLMIIVFVVYPIINSVMRSFKDPDNGSFTLSNYIYFFTEQIQIDHMKYTLYIVAVTVIFTLIFSYTLAVYLRFSNTRLSRIVGYLNLFPRFIPGLVAVYSVILVIRDSGVINRISQLFGYNFLPGLMFNEKGIILMNLWFNIPFATLIIVSSLSGIQDAIIESAKDVGANKLIIFRKMILPLSYKDALVAMTFVFMSNVGSFTTPFLMGGNHPKMLGIALYNQFNNYMDYEKTAALSVIMFLICAVSALVYIYTNMKEDEWEKK